MEQGSAKSFYEKEYIIWKVVITGQNVKINIKGIQKLVKNNKT